MSEYAEQSFDVTEYLSKRPQYPNKIYELILKYHKKENVSNMHTLLDLGCGPGQGNWPFLEQFDELIGIDRGEGMIQCARQAYDQLAKSKKKSGKKVASANYHICAVEAMDSLELPDQSIDLAIAATAAQWFDMQSTYDRLAKLMKKDGTVAFWTYDLAYPKFHPSTLEMISRFAYEDMAKYVDQKGCKRIQSLYEEIDQPPTNDWKNVRHFVYPNFGRNKNFIPVLQNESTAHLLSNQSTEWDWDLHTDSISTWNELAAAKRTNSSYFNWRKEHPDIPIEKDIAARQVSAIRDQVLSDRDEGIGCETGQSNDQVQLMRPMGLLLMQRR